MRKNSSIKRSRNKKIKNGKKAKKAKEIRGEGTYKVLREQRVRGDMMKRKNKKGTGTGIIVFVVLCIFGIVAFGKFKLEDEKKVLDTKKKSLETQINDEKERAIDIKNLEAYVQTKKYIEQIAREKLGLVYEYEIIFKEED